MKILITGAEGMVGSDLVPVLRAAGHVVMPTCRDPKEPGIHEMDITDRMRVKEAITKTMPDVVIHLAAETNVDRCESEPDRANKINVQGTRHIVDVCKEFNFMLVYISTAGVFDGKKQGPYVETDIPNPINVYGKTKLQGEVLVRTNLKKYFIIRAGWMIGGVKKDKKFVSLIINQIQKGATTIKAVTDKIGSPTFTLAFSKCIEQLIRTKKYGTYHMACQGQCSRYDIAKKIVEFLGRDIKVVGVDSSAFPAPAPRPHSEVMKNQHLQELGMDTMPYWEDALAEYLKQNFR